MKFQVALKIGSSFVNFEVEAENLPAAVRMVNKAEISSVVALETEEEELVKAAE